ncbi:hypothetical protein BK133_05040 [Paenibacillus sp. FSL H8-0548]|nr:hypothetical protein BK133_05040 [Paenibacillus sp. FSL H8-0548]
MTGNDIQVLSEIRERMVRVETKMDAMIETKETASAAAKEAAEALLSAKSAHHRIDDLNRRVDDVKSTNKWAIGITLTTLGLFFTAIGFLWKLIER